MPGAWCLWWGWCWLSGPVSRSDRGGVGVSQRVQGVESDALRICSVTHQSCGARQGTVALARTLARLLQVLGWWYLLAPVQGAEPGVEVAKLGEEAQGTDPSSQCLRVVAEAWPHFQRAGFQVVPPPPPPLHPRVPSPRW